MSDTQAFDVAKLKSGDEVGIEQYCEHGWVPWSTGRVVTIHSDGTIELEGHQRYGPDGRRLFTSLRYRLRPPTDEGRWAALQETVATDLDILADQTRSMDLAALRRLKAWIDAKGWEA